MKQQIDNGRLVIAYVTADANQTYTAGATQLVVYRIDDNYVYVLSPNSNKNPSVPLSVATWKAAENGGWFKRAYLYWRGNG